MLKKSFLVLCLFILSYSLFGQNMDKYKNINWRIYHQLNFSDFVDINSEEWKNMSKKEKKELMQIPENELKTMSTKDLIETYINCAYTRSFFLYSDVDKYYEKLKRSFNGVNELLNRQDAVDEILRYYLKMDPKDNTISTGGIQIPFQIQFLEYLIGNPDFVKKISSSQLPLIATELIKKYQMKIKTSPLIIETIESNIYAISRLLCRNETGKHNKLTSLESIHSLQKTGRLPNDRIASQIINLANDFIGK
ncbi:MAG: hypothetical protein NTX22_14800 [Ignavibacteriales bacterium]|nr:hypothetical protein [Ignavibacteriales bacterium]